MRKIFLVALLCLAFAQLKAQNGVVFKIKYLPNKNYQMTVNVGMKVNATVSGDSAIIKMLASQGITQPVLADIELGMAGNMKTGMTDAANNMPLSMDLKFSKLSVSANGKQAPLPGDFMNKDIRIAGHVGQDGVMAIDSADGKKANDTTQKKMQQMMSMIRKQIQFPDKPMKPGDSFTQTMPINIPVKGGNEVKMDYHITYKLVSVANGLANFDVVPTFSMSMTMKNTTVNISGTGQGRMVYSIKDNFATSNDGNYEMKIKVNSPKTNVDGTLSVTTSSTVVIN